MKKILLLLLVGLLSVNLQAQKPPIIKKDIHKEVINPRLLNPIQPDNWSFETGNLSRWTKAGEAFNNQPTAGEISNAKYRSGSSACWDGSRPAFTDQTWNHGFQGNFWVSSGENHPSAAATFLPNYILTTTGSLYSAEFTTTKNWISFLLSGKSQGKQCSVDILVLDDGTISQIDSLMETQTRVVAGRPVTVIRRIPIEMPRVAVDGKNYFVVNSIVNSETENDNIRTQSAAAVRTLDQIDFKRVYCIIIPKIKGKQLRIRIVDNDPGGYIAADDFRFETAQNSPMAVLRRPRMADCPLQGIVDLHTHPMSYLGFGRKAVHGALDTGSLIPAGTYNCNPTAFRATTIREALGSCNSTHGGWGIDNGCGDYLRAAIINYALDGSFVHKVSFDRNPHGDHEHAGYPAMRFWPHSSSILHQQMWVDWIRRAHKGGIKSIVALTVNSELLATISNGDGPFDDKTVSDLQIDEMIAFVGRHRDFMEVAYSPADYRRIIQSGKMAVILGMEVDKIGNFGKSGVVTNETTVRAEIRRLYRKGVRYIFPIHLIDNSFGGTAVYSMLFNFANKHGNGNHFNVMHSPDPNVRYSADIRVEGVPTPVGLDNSLILGVRGILEGIGQIPAPCFNDLIKCSPPPGKVRCCGSYESIMNMMTVGAEFDRYKFIPGGHMNATGLSSLGEVAINEMMKLGIMIDIDHMGELSQTRAITIAEGITGGYPLMMGHNAVRGTNDHTMKERSAPLELVNRVAALGGIFGVGTAETHPSEFIQNANHAWAAMGNKNIAIGTDVNGFEKLPHPGGGSTVPQWQREGRLTEFTASFGVCRTGDKTWNYFRDDGVSHYGIMPEFFWDVKTNFTGGEAVVNRLQHSAESMAKLWEKVERVKASVR